MTVISLNPRKMKVEPQAIREHASPALGDFDEDAIRNQLIQAVGCELSMIAESAGRSLTMQIQAIRQSTDDFDGTISRMAYVLECVRDVETSNNEVVQNAEVTSQELGTVNSQM